MIHKFMSTRPNFPILTALGTEFNMNPTQIQWIRKTKAVVGLRLTRKKPTETTLLLMNDK